jgi:hypothetical protein
MTEKTETKQPETTAPQSAAPAAEQSSVDLTVQDLALMKNIIDLSATRGAFKPAEMAAVGGVYNKLSAFLESVNKGQSQNG